MDLLTFEQLWQRSVAAHGDRTFLLFRDRQRTDAEWTYAEFDRLVTAAAARLEELGASRERPVHLCVGNCPAFVLLWLAASRIGTWIVPVDPTSGARELQHQAERTSPAVTFIAAEHADAAAALSNPVVALEQTADDLRHGGPLVPEHGGEPGARQAPAPLERLAVMFTSGTTSQPKGVVLTQANYGYTGRTMAELSGLRPHHRWLVTLPLFHANAQFYCFASAIATGASVALTSSFSASGWVDDASALRATHASLFAAPIRMILSKQADRPATAEGPQLSLTHVWFAQNLSHAHYEAFARLCGVLPRQLYGMTETTAVVACQPPGREGPDSIGPVIPGRRIRIHRLAETDAAGAEARPESAEALAAATRSDEDRPGLLQVYGRRGVELFREYLDAPEVTRRAFASSAGEEAHDDDLPEVLFTTGDLVTSDASGVLRFAGRSDDIIKVAGENISLAEVEAVLAEAPGVLEVAVVSEADPIRDAVPVAHVVAQDPAHPPLEAELMQYAAQHLPKAARPHRWKWLEALPRTSVGKIRRHALRQ
ncbi:class I adenylate-forming enzyme family protein [Brevibacterium salitolerans]|uniref:ATP-dependent acyl-CoA ligase n=1 Tax=Brevibacterium salitolerans TaxID=1403566 RepID=A0ABN2WM54_9MICO